MTELLTAAQMRAIEQAAIASGEVTGLQLMERAGAGVVEAVLAEWPELATTSHRAVVLCGPGNNGGDGFVVARLLKERGWEVEVFLYGDAGKLPPDAKVNCQRWREIGKVHSWDFDAFEKLSGVDVLIDAVFGIGLSRPLPDEVIEAFGILKGAIRPDAVRGHRRRYRRAVAVDVPSGLNSDTGEMLTTNHRHDLHARLCVTFCMAKVGHHLAHGPHHCHKLAVKPLGLRREEFLERLHHDEPPNDRRVRLFDWNLFGSPAPFWRQLDKGSGNHKYTHGHALVLSGPATRGGAARLSACAALRIGAGLVTLGAPADALLENAARLDAVMLREATTPADLTALLEDDRLNAVCLGPGLGAERAAELVPAALAAKLATVLDADALTFLSRTARMAEQPYAEPYAEPYAQPYAGLHGECVLTPHAGEFARLFPDLAGRLAEPATKGPAFSKVDATREAAKRAGCVVVFKGPDTVIADPSGICAVNSSAYDRAAPWLATAGTGDVLAGMITGLLARGFAPFEAAETAAWLHTECALHFGPGLIAEDLPEQLPAVFRKLGL